jgi:rfaE bifunctional protein nucleotidyltransferase chain/domain
MPDSLRTHSPFKATAPDQLPAQVEELVRLTRQQGKTLVLATGVFDVLHQEHVLFLQKAKQVGDVLVVGVEANQRVKQLKGQARPIHSEEARRQQLEGLHIADMVFILPDAFNTEAEYRAFTHHLKPDILAVSSHTNFQELKQKLMQEVGGELRVVHEHNPAISTTILLKQKQV